MVRKIAITFSIFLNLEFIGAQNQAQPNAILISRAALKDTISLGTFVKDLPADCKNCKYELMLVSSGGTIKIVNTHLADKIALPMRPADLMSIYVKVTDRGKTNEYKLIFGK